MVDCSYKNFFAEHRVLSIGTVAEGMNSGDAVLSQRTTVTGAALLKLFFVLNTWQLTSQLILELHVCSSNDSERWFKN